MLVFFTVAAYADTQGAGPIEVPGTRGDAWHEVALIVRYSQSSSWFCLRIYCCYIVCNSADDKGGMGYIEALGSDSTKRYCRLSVGLGVSALANLENKQSIACFDHRRMAFELELLIFFVDFRCEGMVLGTVIRSQLLVLVAMISLSWNHIMDSLEVVCQRATVRQQGWE